MQMTLNLTERKAPWTDNYVAHITDEHHQMGLSPCIIKGVCGYRVVWRPFLDEPIAYTQANGKQGYKIKADNVRTLWFPIIGGTTEAQAYAAAKAASEEAYRSKVAAAPPNVDWQKMAKRAGVKIRSEYAKPALNGARDRAAALFALGWSDHLVAQRIGVDRSTASRWRKKMGLRK